MHTPQVPDREPIWWVSAQAVVWQWVESTRRDEFGHRLREQEKTQGPDNSIFGRTGEPRNIDVEHAFLVPDEDWETGMT